MATEETKTMKEIHDIRQKIYEEIKDMTAQEMIAYFKEKGEQHEKESGIKLKKLQKV